MSASLHIRDVSNLEIVAELCLLFFNLKKVIMEIEIENSQSLPKKANKSHFCYDILPKQECSVFKSK